MNNWLNRLERRYGRFGIPNLTNILVGGQILVLAIELFVNQTISVWLSLSRYLLLSGQIWRIITFVFIPSYGGSILSAVLGIYFHLVHRHGAGTGVGRFPLYGLSAVRDVGHRAGLPAHRRQRQHLLPVPFAAAGLCHAVPGGTGAAVLCDPCPGEVFWLFAAILWVLSFLGAPLPQKLSLLLSMANVWLFFGPMGYRAIRAWVRREQWKRKNRR